MAKKETINIMAIDPSSNALGICVYKIDVASLEIVSIFSRTINLKLKNYDEDRDNVLSRFIELERELKAYMKHFDPRMLSIETGFINKLRPAAYGPLSQCIMIAKMCATNYNPLIHINGFPPSIIKKAIGASFKADKDEVLEHVLKIKEVVKHVDPRIVSDHEVDAIAINYVQIKYLRNNEGLLCLI